MIDLANAAFAALSSFHADFAGLYDAVRDYILYHFRLSEANKELRSNECSTEMLDDLKNSLNRLYEVAKKLCSTEKALTEAETDGATLVTRISETRNFLKELEEKLEERNKEIDSLKAEHDELGKTCITACAELKVFEDQLTEKNKINKQINGRIDKARAGIERTKALLSSLC